LFLISSVVHFIPFRFIPSSFPLLLVVIVLTVVVTFFLIYHCFTVVDDDSLLIIRYIVIPFIVTVHSTIHSFIHSCYTIVTVIPSSFDADPIRSFVPLTSGLDPPSASQPALTGYAPLVTILYIGYCGHLLALCSPSAGHSVFPRCSFLVVVQYVRCRSFVRSLLFTFTFTFRYSFTFCSFYTRFVSFVVLVRSPSLRWHISHYTDLFVRLDFVYVPVHVVRLLLRFIHCCDWYVHFILTDNLNFTFSFVDRCSFVVRVRSSLHCYVAVCLGTLLLITVITIPHVIVRYCYLSLRSISLGTFVRYIVIQRGCTIHSLFWPFCRYLNRIRWLIRYICYSLLFICYIWYIHCHYSWRYVDIYLGIVHDTFIRCHSLYIPLVVIDTFCLFIPHYYSTLIFSIHSFVIHSFIVCCLTHSFIVIRYLVDDADTFVPLVIVIHSLIHSFIHSVLLIHSLIYLLIHSHCEILILIHYIVDFHSFTFIFLLHSFIVVIRYDWLFLLFICCYIVFIHFSDSFIWLLRYLHCTFDLLRFHSTFSFIYSCSFIHWWPFILMIHCAIYILLLPFIRWFTFVDDYSMLGNVHSMFTVVVVIHSHLKCLVIRCDSLCDYLIVHSPPLMMTSLTGSFQYSHSLPLIHCCIRYYCWYIILLFYIVIRFTVIHWHCCVNRDYYVFVTLTLLTDCCWRSLFPDHFIAGIFIDDFDLRCDCWSLVYIILLTLLFIVIRFILPVIIIHCCLFLIHSSPVFWWYIRYCHWCYIYSLHSCSFMEAIHSFDFVT